MCHHELASISVHVHTHLSHANLPHNPPMAILLFTRYLHVWPHTLVRAVGFNLYSLIRSWTTSAWPSWAAPCSMVNPMSVALWSRDCIFGARYWIVLTWPRAAALWRAFCPAYMRETHNNWTHDWYNIGVDMNNGHTSAQESMLRNASMLCECGGSDRVWLCTY